MQENVRECTKVHEIREHFLSQTIPDIWYMIFGYDSRRHRKNTNTTTSINCYRASLLNSESGYHGTIHALLLKDIDM